MSKAKNILEISKIEEQAIQYKSILKSLQDAEKGLKIFGNNSTKTAKVLHSDLLKTVQDAIKKADNLYKNGD